MATTQWKKIKDLLYAKAQEMQKDTDPKWFYNWAMGYRADLDQDQADAVFIIEYPVNTPYETNNDDAGGITDFQYRNLRTINFVARVMSDQTEVTVEDLIIDNDDALDKALEDILRRFNGVIEPDMCPLGVFKVQYLRAYKRPLEAGSVYYPFELVVEYGIEYIKPREN